MQICLTNSWEPHCHYYIIVFEFFCCCFPIEREMFQTLGCARERLSICLNFILPRRPSTNTHQRIQILNYAIGYSIRRLFWRYSLANLYDKRFKASFLLSLFFYHNQFGLNILSSSFFNVKLCATHWNHLQTRIQIEISLGHVEYFCLIFI